MPSCIKVLSEETINKIAAGEVVESPASVVKELVENSLDAQAKEIIIEVAAGGFQLIRISDDGIGMSQDDAVLSLERHATSKVRLVEDLFSIHSMGFRGEALASIAAISKLTLLTSEQGAGCKATKVIAEGGRIRFAGEASRQRGTTIEIASLFYTVPARKKFQKSPPQALADIHKTVIALALARPDIAFKLQSYEESLLQTESGSLKKRVEEVLGKEYLDNSMAFVYEESWIKLEGFIGRPGAARSNRGGQYLFVNQRAVASSAVSFAVADGYATMLEVRKHPLFVLYMTLNPELIDINVHPQKKEVRFKEEALVKEVIRKAVGKALQGEGRKEVAQISPLKVAPSKSLEEILEKKPQNPKEFCGFNVKNKPELTKVQEDLLPWEVPMLPKVEDVEVLGLHRHYLWLEAGSAEKVLCPPYIKGGEGGLFVVDLKAGLSRIYFEKVGSETQLGLQALLFPKTFRVATQEVVYFMEALPSLEKLGIQMRAFGESTFLIEACHKDIEEDKLEDTLYELLEEMKKGERGDMERRLALKVASRVGRRKMRFELAEAKGILSQLLKTAQPYFCPFGKKTIAHMSMQYYDKLFI